MTLILISPIYVYPPLLLWYAPPPPLRNTSFLYYYPSCAKFVKAK